MVLRRDEAQKPVVDFKVGRTPSSGDVNGFPNAGRAIKRDADVLRANLLLQDRELACFDLGDVCSHMAVVC